MHLLALLALPLTAPTNDWPQWRGPDRDGISRETEWRSEGRPAWDRRVGLGYSAVSVVGDRLYTAGWDEEDEKDVVWCLDATTGDVVWEHRYPAKKWDKYHGGGTQSTPSVAGENVFVLNREGRFLRLDSETGDARWSRNVAEEHDLELPTWGFSASPLVLEDTVVLNVGPVLACDRGNGKVLWRSERDYGHAYSTPVDAKLAGQDVLVVLGGAGLAVLERDGGRELGFYEWKTKYDINAGTPVIVGDDRILISSGYGHGAAMVRFTGDAIETLWETKALRSQMATTMLVDGHFYGLDDKVLKCFDLDGEEKWSARSIGLGALSAAGDRLLVVTGEGELVVAKANPEEFEELSRVDLVDGGVCWTMPVLANGRVYVRNSHGHLVCRDHRPPTDQ